MPYKTVFEITKEPFQWWFPAYGLIFIVIGTVLIFVGKKWPSFPMTKRAKWLGYFFVPFASLWTVVAFLSTYTIYRAAIDSYLSNNTEIIEGVVENFQPMPYTGHRDECFTVRDTRFCYSDYRGTPAFNQTASHGGPIRESLPVRITHHNGQILRLDISADKLPTPTERSARAKLEEEQFRERLRRGPFHTRAALAIWFAVAIISCCWSVDWRHYLRYWLKVPPPYSRYTEFGFRAILAWVFLGVLFQMVSDIRDTARSAADYGWAILFGAAVVGAFLARDGYLRWHLRRNSNDGQNPR
jgi:hypothetical protein